MKPESRFYLWGIALISLGAVLTAISAAAYYIWLPNVGFLATNNPRTTAYMQIYVRRTIAKGKKPLVVMRWTPLYEISPYLRQAVLIGEDDAFYHHGAVDWQSLKKAIEYDRRKGRLLRGASTITQQVARNLYLSPERSGLRKLKEILIAKKLEQVLTKDRILEIYLNIAEWGKGIYGAQAASQIYFGKNASELNPDEAAALAVALPSPWKRNPLRAAQEPILARKKEVILGRMRKAGYLPPGVSEREIEVPGMIESAGAAGPAAAKPAPIVPCGSPAAGGPAQKLEEPPDSCGSGTPSLLGR